MRLPVRSHLLPAAPLLPLALLVALAVPGALAAERTEAASEQASPIAAATARARASLERLEKDPRRRRYRDGWVAIAADLDAAARQAPRSPEAAEALLLSGRAKEGLWLASRTKVDARAAIDRYRLVDQRFPKLDAGRRALVAAMRLAKRTGDGRQLSACADLLARRPQAGREGAELREAREALAKSPGHARPPAKIAPAAPGGGLAALIESSRAATPADRMAQRPLGEPEGEGDEAAGSPARGGTPARAEPAAPVRPLSPTRTARAAREAPPSPEQEPDSDVPAGASHLLDALVQSVRSAGAELAGGSTSTGAGATAAAASRDADGPPEPEEADQPEPSAVPHKTRASAPRTFAVEEAAPEAEEKARALRSTALAAHATPLAAQLGLKVRTIAIDPGHGGRDGGAVGPRALREKDATLAIARKLAVKLRALGFNVLLTRDGDQYVGLSERTRIANDAGADLFLSIHCNAARAKKLSGIETWTLNVSSDRYAQRLAAFENAEAEETVGRLRMILADLATRANAGDSRELASSVQSSLVRTLRARVGKVKDHGVKQALFYVLLGAHMPSILVETAFLSNPEEERRLRTPKYQEGAADAIARGVKDFVDSRRRLALAP